jgi:hypothetical protein
MPPAFRANFAYIGGYDPSDPNNTKLTVPLATAKRRAASVAVADTRFPRGLGLEQARHRVSSAGAASLLISQRV